MPSYAASPSSSKTPCNCLSLQWGSSSLLLRATSKAFQFNWQLMLLWSSGLPNAAPATASRASLPEHTIHIHPAHPSGRKSRFLWPMSHLPRCHCSPHLTTSPLELDWLTWLLWPSQQFLCLQSANKVLNFKEESSPLGMTVSHKHTGSASNVA